MSTDTTSVPYAARTSTFDTVAGYCARYSLVAIIVLFGAVKFTEWEAKGIYPLVSESPFMAWLYGIFSVYAFSALLGVVELTAALLLAVKPWWPKASIGGSLLAIGLFIATLSFLFTTPGVTDAALGGFPALSATGNFLVKDIVLLGVSVWTLSDALRAVRR